MLPSESHATLDTWPSVHPFGICGQDGSTANFGTSTDAGRGNAAETWRDPAITNGTTATNTMPALAHKFRFTFMILILLFVFACECSDSTGSTPGNRYFRFGPLAWASYAPRALDTTNLPLARSASGTLRTFYLERRFLSEASSYLAALVLTHRQHTSSLPGAISSP